MFSTYTYVDLEVSLSTLEDLEQRFISATDGDIGPYLTIEEKIEEGFQKRYLYIHRSPVRFWAVV